MKGTAALAFALTAVLAVSPAGFARARHGRMAGQEYAASEVRQVQQKLDDMGYHPGAKDGVMGTRTETALRNFQRDKGINATGQLDDQTLSALGVRTGSANAGRSGSERPAEE
jgi:peptidoglycan hydrolase-like protein with peptidoglycan-binding domain